MFNLLKSKLTSRKGQGTVEYALATIAVVIIVAAVLISQGAASPLGTAITKAFTEVSTQVTKATA